MTPDPSRARRLKAATTQIHDRLDTAVMAGNPFGSRDNYAKFLRMQYVFHRDIDGLYDDPRLTALLPDMATRRRWQKVADDLRDLGCDPPDADRATIPDDLAERLGWLYVAEGSNLGAAFLFKDAQGLGLSAEHGARHLAGATEGRGLHWRTFTAALDGADLTEADEARAVAGARAAFDRVRALVDLYLR
ncbi:biliverdin-producing heme oxygenase [Asticcacaulis sp. BYS171W]|uniref:Biliverdin-producing heme oxygenase n=1 Tax=Asticcacaulis aquaticus TaxID=2984212 RepID=A0ABT5HWX4_9CAUL|nr:biliverdin-producing heme oxygenase [Asticcacaulis aquaticus]MDC7684584.1 biliverdin-producing heme oxygenase [Asticcacaulis aquaticus]